MSRKTQILAFAIILPIALMILGCDADQTSKPADDPEAPGVWTGANWETPEDGADPDGVGLDGDPDDVIERVTLPTGELVDPGDSLPDLTEVIVVYASGRVEKTTWGRIKEEYQS